MLIPDTVLTVPAGNYRNTQLFSYLHKGLMGTSQTDAISRIDHRAFCLTDLCDNSLCRLFCHFLWKDLAFFPFSRFIFRDSRHIFLLCPAISPFFIIFRVKSNKLICFHISALYI